MSGSVFAEQSVTPLPQICFRRVFDKRHQMILSFLLARDQNSGDRVRDKAIDSAAVVTDGYSVCEKEPIIAKSCARYVKYYPPMLLVLDGSKRCLVSKCSRVRAAESGIDSG